MKPQEILGSIIAVKGAGMAASLAAATGFQLVMDALPILRPICWGLSVLGLLILLAGLAIAATAESAGEVS